MKHHNLKRTLLVLIAVLAILALTGCGSKTEVDLKEVVSLELSGVDGYGSAYAKIDEQLLYALVRPDEAEEYNTMDAINTLDLISRIDCTLDRTEKLSNGDNVTVTITYPDTLEEALDVSFTPKSGESWTVEITGLGEPEKVDLFENISLQYFTVRGTVRYSFVKIDLDGDLIEELISLEEYKIGDNDWHGAILDIFTMKDERPNWLIAGAYRGDVDIFEDGIIRYLSHGGAHYYTYHFYTIQDGELSPVMTAGEEDRVFSVNGEVCTYDKFLEAVDQYAPILALDLERLCMIEP